MNNLLIRASQASKLMTEPKLKSDKEAGNLSETMKSYLSDLWLEYNYGYKDIVYTDPLLKGLLCEQDSMELVQSVLGGQFRNKNTEHFKNDFVMGTPDIVLKDCVEDIKTSYNIKTFFDAELEKSYYWQGICYMALTGIHNYRLIYCLVDTPDELITSEKTRMYYKFGCNEENIDYQIASKQIEINNKYSHLPESDRIKIFEFQFNESDYEKLCNQIIKARNYYNQITLK